MHAPVVWALVMDENTARIVRNAGQTDHSAPDPEEIVITSPHKRMQDIMSDKPGRSYASVGSARSSMEYKSDPIRDAMHKFATEVIGALSKHKKAGAFDKLAIFAGPEMLGILRDTLTRDLKDCLTAEKHKQLTNLSRHDLRATVAEMLARPA